MRFSEPAVRLLLRQTPAWLSGFSTEHRENSLCARYQAEKPSEVFLKTHLAHH